jgi:hypothetical protein
MREALLVSIVGYRCAAYRNGLPELQFIAEERRVSPLFDGLFADGPQDVLGNIPTDFRNKSFLAKRAGTPEACPRLKTANTH